MTWGIDFTATVRSDLVGLDPDLTTEIVHTLVRWGESGPPRMGRRSIGGVEFFESDIAGQYFIAYIIDEDRQRFALLWLREQPGRALT